MATTVTRRTVTTSRSGVSSTTTIPLWAIKLVAAVLSLVVLILVFMQHPSVWSGFSRTFIFIVLTCGFILGWSIQSVLWRFLPMHRVDAVLHSVIVALALISTVLCVIFLIDQNRYARSDAYSYMVGTSICMGIITLITFFLIGCLCRGNYTFVDTH
uniref:MARVEL domain-containing protein n=1 Tax=Panagrellus redivivus TaxID=6233 RepID=A0A7E5A0Z9_PANRE